MNLRTRIAGVACACMAVVLLAPATALAHHHHHFGVLLKGVVSSVDTSNHSLVFKVDKSTRGGAALVGDNVTVKVVRSRGDVNNGDTVLVWTKRRFIDSDSNTIAAAQVWDKDRSGEATVRSGDRDGRCDHR